MLKSDMPIGTDVGIFVYNYDTSLWCFVVVVDINENLKQQQQWLMVRILLIYNVETLYVVFEIALTKWPHF